MKSKPYRRQRSQPVLTQATVLQLDALTDNELLVLFVDRDNEPAFNELVSRHSGMVLRICRAVVSNQSCVDDAFQATFLSVIRNARRLRSATSFSGWLCRVARNAAIKASKSQRSRERQMDDAEPTIEADALAELAARETAQSLAESLDTIPSRYKEALTLFYYQDLSRKEIAGRLDCTETTVKALLQRGKQLLRTRLARKGIVPAVVAHSILVMAQTTEAASNSDLIAKTTEACVTYKAAPTTVPTELLDLSQASQWSATTLNSMVLQSILVASVSIVAVVIPAMTPSNNSLAHLEHRVFLEQPASEPTGSNSIKITDAEDLGEANKETDAPANIQPAKLRTEPLARTDHRIDRNVSFITSTGKTSR